MIGEYTGSARHKISSNDPLYVRPVYEGASAWRPTNLCANCDKFLHPSAVGLWQVVVSMYMELHSVGAQLL